MKIDIEAAALSKFVRIAAPSDKSVLEIGCGTGRLTFLLAEKTKRLTAIDLAPDLLFEARPRSANTRFLAASGEHLPFQAEAFDCLLFSQSLHHQNSVKALDEATRAVKPGGRVVVLEPVFGSELEEVCGHFQNESESRLKALYAVLDANLQIEGIDFFSTIWRFESRFELHRWLFDYYQSPYDPALAGRVDATLGEKSEQTPLDIGEKLLLISLLNQRAGKANRPVERIPK